MVICTSAIMKFIPTPQNCLLGEDKSQMEKRFVLRRAPPCRHIYYKLACVHTLNYLSGSAASMFLNMILEIDELFSTEQRITGETSLY